MNIFELYNYVEWVRFSGAVECEGRPCLNAVSAIVSSACT